MNLINSEVLEHRKTELYNFISQYGNEYLELILLGLRLATVRRKYWNQRSNPNYIYKKVLQMQQNRNSKEEQFYQEIKNFAFYEWQSTEEFARQLTQLFSKFGIINEQYDIYIKVYHLLQKYGFLDENCCEVGAGEYPRLSEIVYPEIKSNKHNLVVYEPEVILSKLDNITIIKDKFTKETDLSDIGTLFAIHPCEATATIAEKAFEEDKNLILVCCGCDHADDKYRKWGMPYWSQALCMEFKEQYGDEAIIEKWPMEYNIPYPILIRESSKQKLKRKYENKYNGK